MRKVLVVLGIAVVALVAIGFVVLASASQTGGIRLHHDLYYFVKRQAVWLALAGVLCYVAARFDYHYWSTTPALVFALFFGVAVLLAAVFLFPKINGSHRWLALGPVRLQPSEFSKLAIVIALAVWLDRIGWRVELFLKGALVPAVIIGAYAVLLLAEPDFGSTIVVGAIGGVLMLVAGTRIAYIVLLGAVGGAGFVGLLMTNANRMARIMAFLAGADGDASNAPLSESAKRAAYQLQQAIIAIHNGGIWGVGFNNSMQKQYYLPEAHNDFIFAIGAEELGIIFSVGILILFIAIFVCGVIISLKATDRLGRLIAFGMTFLIFFQAVFNIGVVTGFLPTKGLALPFISYGGTNLVTALVAVGTLLNVGIQAARNRGRQFPRAAAIPAR